MPLVRLDQHAAWCVVDNSLVPKDGLVGGCSKSCGRIPGSVFTKGIIRCGHLEGDVHFCDLLERIAQRVERPEVRAWTNYYLSGTQKCLIESLRGPSYFIFASARANCFLLVV